MFFKKANQQLNNENLYTVKSFNFVGTKISWFDDIGHVRGHLNPYISIYMFYTYLVCALKIGINPCVTWTPTWPGRPR